MDRENGQTKEISRRHENSRIETERTGLGEIGSSSTECGINSFFSCGEDRAGGDINWKLTPVRDTTAGKILERLEALESQYLEYVHSHQARLKARLGESEQAEEEFINESNQIKIDIYHLAVAQQNSNGNEHQ